jgi:hypothetical protein
MRGYIIILGTDGKAMQMELAKRGSYAAESILCE